MARSRSLRRAGARQTPRPGVAVEPGSRKQRDIAFYWYDAARTVPLAKGDSLDARRQRVRYAFRVRVRAGGCRACHWCASACWRDPARRRAPVELPWRRPGAGGALCAVPSLRSRCPSGGIGRRARFRVVCPYGRAGSIPVSGTPGGPLRAISAALLSFRASPPARRPVLYQRLLLKQLGAASTRHTPWAQQDRAGTRDELSQGLYAPFLEGSRGGRLGCGPRF